MNSTVIKSSALTIEISSLGAELHSIKTNDGTEYLWQAGTAWSRHAPVLFPIVGKLKNDTYIYQDRAYKMPQHGFARDHEFRLIEENATKCTFELLATEETLKIYPFRFSLRISYLLIENTVTCFYQVVNQGDNEMLFSIGAHPGFRCPVLKNEQFEDHELQFGQRTFLQTCLKEGLRSSDTKVLPLEGKNLRLSPTLFDNDALVFENGQVESLKLVSTVSGRSVSMECRGWPYFGIWSKKGNREFLCLEPWYGIADHVESSQVLEKKDGIIKLGLGKGFSCQFSFAIT